MDKIIADTNVLIDNKGILDNKNVIVPYCILGELDGLKNNKYIGHKVRAVVNKIIFNDIQCEYFNIEAPSVDDKLIAICKKYEFDLITDDGLMYKKAECLGVKVEFYKFKFELYTGVESNLDLTDEDLIEFRKDGRLTYLEYAGKLYENQFVENGILARYRKGMLHEVKRNRKVNGVDKPTLRQLMALDILFDEDVPLVAMTGDKGTGKTTLAINSAIEQVQAGKYDKIYISRPKKQRNIDEGFGYLPGELSNKYKQFNAPFYDNMYSQNSVDIEIVPLSSIQGRNLSNAVWVVTEFQDIAPEDTELVIGRAGYNNKVIIEGDIYQNSDNKLNCKYNGLSHVINRLKESPLTGTVLLDENKRSQLSELSIKLRV